MFQAKGFTFRWVAVCLAASYALHAGLSAASETEIVVIGETVFKAPDLRPASMVRGDHETRAPGFRTVILPEITIAGDRVQALPRGEHINCQQGRGVVEHGRTDARGIPLPSAARCL